MGFDVIPAGGAAEHREDFTIPDPTDNALVEAGTAADIEAFYIDRYGARGSNRRAVGIIPNHDRGRLNHHRRRALVDNRSGRGRCEDRREDDAARQSDTQGRPDVAVIPVITSAAAVIVVVAPAGIDNCRRCGQKENR